MIQTGKNYVYGTAAEKLDYNVYEENTVLKTKKVQRNNNKAKLRLVLVCFMVFAASFMVIHRYAVITELNYKAAKLTKQFNQIKNENSRLTVQIENETDLHKIKDIAEQRLGMQKPDKYQTIYVNVAKKDFTKVSDEYKDAGKKAALDYDKNQVGMFAGILDKFSKITDVIF